MVIVDTSIWVDFFRVGDDRLAGLMATDALLQHPHVTAEVSMGGFRNVAARAAVVELLQSFAQVSVAEQTAFHDFVAQRMLFGTGIGFADAHLLISAAAHSEAALWTRDKRLLAQAQRLELRLMD